MSPIVKDLVGAVYFVFGLGKPVESIAGKIEPGQSDKYPALWVAGGPTKSTKKKFEKFEKRFDTRQKVFYILQNAKYNLSQFIATNSRKKGDG